MKEGQLKRISKTEKMKKNQVMQCYLMIALPLIGFFVFILYPIFWTFRLSAFSYNGVASMTKFVGLDNFKTLFTTYFTYWKMWGNTLIFTVCKIPVELSLAMLLAVLLNGKLKGSSFFRSAYYLPNVVSVAIVGLVFSNLFSYYGIINAMLAKLGLIKEGVEWFSTRGKAITVVVTASIWNTFGVNVMYLLAALSNVPTEVYEAADLDGAKRFTKFFKITLPLIAPVFQTILLLSILGTLGANELIIVLTGGAPGGQTNTVMSYLTSQFVPGFFTSSSPALGYGSAMSVITTIIFAVVAIFYNKFSKKLSEMY